MKQYSRSHNQIRVLTLVNYILYVTLGKSPVRFEPQFSQRFRCVMVLRLPEPQFHLLNGYYLFRRTV